MSYHAYFLLSTGIARDLKVPTGTIQAIWKHINETEEKLGLSRQSRQDGQWCWGSTEAHMTNMAKSAPSEREFDARINGMSQAVIRHNWFVRELYSDFAEWSEQESIEGEWEKITPEHAQAFWGGLVFLELPKKLWSRDHFVDYMKHLHDLMTTGESRGAVLDCAPLTAEQADQFLGLFEHELDQWGFDVRMTVPLNANLEPYDFAVTVDEYDWCSKCGPIYTNDTYQRCLVCPRAEAVQCELKNEGFFDFDDENELES